MATVSHNTRTPHYIPTESSSFNRNIQCHYCQKFGHRYTECRKRLSHGNHRAPNHKAAAVPHIDTSDMSYTNVAHTPQPNTLSPVEIKALIHQVLSKSTLNTAMSTTPGNSSWYIDSACYNHMTPKSSIFSKKSVLPKPTTIYTANGSHLNVSHIGSISTHQLSMSDTYLMPNLSLNLLSVGQLCELGLELHFSKRGCDVQDPQTRQLIGTTRKIGRLFELSSLHFPPIMSAATPFQSPFTTLSLWHSRLGHAFISRIRSLATSG
jgi:hypothetical protein